MKIMSWILLFSMFFYCCTSTHTVIRSQTAYDQLNKQLDGKKSKITLLNDSIVVAENINIGVRTSSWQEVQFKGRYTQDKKTNPINRIIPTANIKNIITKQHGRGALEGFGIGALVFLGMGT